MKNSSSHISFNSIANLYDLLGTICFAGNLYKSQVALIPFLPKKVDSVLVLGGGTGKFLEFLLTEISISHVMNVDLSSSMIHLAKQRVYPKKTHINHQIGGIYDLKRRHLFDLVVCNYYFDLFDSLELFSVLKELDLHLKPGGLLFYTDFYIPAEGKGSKLAPLVLWALYKTFNQLTGLQISHLPPIIKCIEKFAYHNSKEAFFMNNIVHSALFMKQP